jgi:RNA polymerase sigma-70 factor (ECF subfamily)
MTLGIGADETLERARRFDAAALALIHDRYYSEVYRYVRFRLPEEAAAEDIASEVFLRLLDALNRQRGPVESLRGWLMGTASNLVNDHLRQRYARPTTDIEDESLELFAGYGSPESSQEDSWQRQQIQKAIGLLTEEQQHVLALRFGDDRSVEETAKIIGKSVNAVKALQFRALASLRRIIMQERV